MKNHHKYNIILNKTKITPPNLHTTENKNLTPFPKKLPKNLGYSRITSPFYKATEPQNQEGDPKVKDFKGSSFFVWITPDGHNERMNA